MYSLHVFHLTQIWNENFANERVSTRYFLIIQLIACKTACWKNEVTTERAMFRQNLYFVFKLRQDSRVLEIVTSK